MVRNLEDSDLSELEREFELEMDDDHEGSEDSEANEDQESVEELEEDSENLREFEGDELEEVQRESGDYADRLHELSQRESESESEVDEEVNGLLDEMEREFFFGGLKKRLKRAGRGLLRKGLKFAAGQIPALQAFKGLTQLTRGNLKGFLASLAKAGLTSAIPGAAAALPALKALGFDPSGDSEASREAWNNYVDVSREAYEYLAENLHENADNPLEASRLATNAFQTALKRVQSRIPPFAGTQSGSYGVRSRSGRRVIHLGPGETVIVKRK
jgi:hypothetical protein